MINIYWIVLLNNVVCIIAALCCFVHALHSGLYTNNFTKLALFAFGLCFYSAYITVQEVLMPGYKYIMFTNITLAISAIWYFVSEAQRFGFAQQWYQSICNLLHIGDPTNVNKK